MAAPPRRMLCLGCRYDLTGNVSHRCPECGQAFAPETPATFGPQPSLPPDLAFWAAGGAAGLLLAASLLPIRPVDWEFASAWYVADVVAFGPKSGDPSGCIGPFVWTLLFGP